MCPRVGTSTHATKGWADMFTPAIAERIKAAAPGAKLKKTDVVNLMSLCPFDTVAHEAPSPWCDLFTPKSGHHTSITVTSLITMGMGGCSSRLCGFPTELWIPKIWTETVGYVNELLSRLTGQPVQDETQTNHKHQHFEVRVWMSFLLARSSLTLLDSQSVVK